MDVPEAAGDDSCGKPGRGRDGAECAAALGSGGVRGAAGRRRVRSHPETDGGTAIVLCAVETADSSEDEAVGVVAPLDVAVVVVVAAPLEVGMGVVVAAPVLGR